MSSAESLRRRQAADDPSLPRTDIRFSLADARDLQTELADVFHSQRAVEEILRSTTFPRGRIPSFENSDAHAVWGEILLSLNQGAIHAGNYQLLTAVLGPYPANEVFLRLSETYLGASQARAGSAAAPPGRDGAERAEETAPPPTCHVIVRASNEETREHAARMLQDLDLDPVEQWSTAHAVSYRVGSDSPHDVRALLERTDIGWTVVAPGLRDYLLHTLYVEGPDGRQFRITDAPAQQTVGNVAAEVVDQYGGDLPDAGRPAVVDQVGPDGQGRRLDPNSTLDESGIRDGDRMRVGFQARAAAVNPLDRQDALYRVRNQIRDFGDARGEGAEFVVRANSALLPTEYEIEFRQPSFGPPPSPDSAPTDIDWHLVLIQLGSDFPESPPMVFWLTRIYHPNVFPTYECEVARGKEVQMGLVCLGALQESYLPSLHFGSLCQLLIDIAAFRNYSLYKSDGTIDATGAQRRRVDYFDPYAAAWVQSEAGQRRIRAINGSPMQEPARTRPEYRNFIEKVDE
jgi:hypothetical protein